MNGAEPVARRIYDVFGAFLTNFRDSKMCDLRTNFCPASSSSSYFDVSLGAKTTRVKHLPILLNTKTCRKMKTQLESPYGLLRAGKTGYGTENEVRQVG